MKKSLLVLASVCFFNSSFAQLKNIDDIKKQLETHNTDTSAWTYGGLYDLGVNEGFLHNWAAGGEVAALAVNSIFSGHLEKLDYRNIWSNSLDLSFGLYYAYSNSFVPRKTDDRIDFTSKYGVRIDTAKNFYVTGLLNFKSQFTKGFDYSASSWDTFSTSRFFSPAYFTLGLGIEYRKGSDISLFLSPVAGRATFVDKYYTTQHPDGAFGVPYNKTARYEFGAYFSGRYARTVSKKLAYKTRLDLYSNYLAKDKKDSLGVVVKKDNPGNISILWDNLISYKLAKYINITFAATFIYDNDVPYLRTTTDENGITKDKNEPGNNLGWLQIKQVLTIGLEYKF